MGCRWRRGAARLLRKNTESPVRLAGPGHRERGRSRPGCGL